MNNAAKDIIAIHGDDKCAGAISYWSTPGAVHIDALAKAWADAGLPEKELPSLPSPTVAVTRALKSVMTPERTNKRVKGGDFKGGWLVIQTDTTGDKPVHRDVLFAVRDDDAPGGVRVKVEPGFEMTDGEPTELVYRKAFRAALNGELDGSGDISPWLRKRVNKLSGVTMRDHGSVYFIPRDGMDEWANVTAAVEAATAKRMEVARIAAMHTDDAVAAVLTAVRSEAETALKAFEDDLCKEGDDRLGKRALANRTKMAEELTAKLAKYEGILGVSLEAFKDSLEGIKASIVAAEMALDDEADGAEANPFA